MSGCGFGGLYSSVPPEKMSISFNIDHSFLTYKKINSIWL
jgi:hypothetical protein